jgi:hypothetical protein
MLEKHEDDFPHDQDEDPMIISDEHEKPTAIRAYEASVIAHDVATDGRRKRADYDASKHHSWAQKTIGDREASRRRQAGREA